MLEARLVHLKIDNIRGPYQIEPNVTIGLDGHRLAALIARWAFEFPEILDQFNAILRRCLPEMKRALVRCTSNGNVSLLFEQIDGERFEASEVSDGVLVFSALIAHALEAPPNGLIMLEEPERGIHPRRLKELVDVLRTLVDARKTQFILATHSTALLNAFRDEPDAILLFRRSQTGTQIRRLSDVPELREALSRADPGELLAGGVFNETLGGDGES